VADERRDAERTAIEEALDALPRLAKRLGADDEVVERIRGDYEGHLALVRAEQSDESDHPLLAKRGDAVELELELVRHKSATVLRMRDDGDIDDLVLRQVRAEYDAEETRLLRQGERD